MRNFLVTCAAIFIAVVFAILPTQPVFASEESEKHHSQAQTYYKEGKYEDAIKEYTEAINLEGNNALYYNNRGCAYLFSSKNNEALADFNKAIELDSNFETSYSGRAIIYLRQNRIDDAKINFLRAARIYIDKEKYDDAEKELNSAIEADNKYGEAYYYLGWVEFCRENYQNAIGKYDEAIKLNFDEDYVYAERGLAKYALGKYKDAIEDFDKTIEIDPNYAEAYEYRGECYYSLSDYEKASEDFKKYLELDGDNLDEKTKENFTSRIIDSETFESGTYESETYESETYEQDTMDLICDKLEIGHVNKLLKALFIVMGLEYAIIIGCGISEGNLTVGVAVREFAIKIIFLIIVIVANSLENLSALSDFEVRDTMIAIILIHELLSVLENAERLGIPVPDWLKNLLQNIKDAVNDLFQKVFGGNNRQS